MHVHFRYFGKGKLKGLSELAANAGKEGEGGGVDCVHVDDEIQEQKKSKT